MPQTLGRKARRVEILRIRPEAHPGTGIALSHTAHGLQFTNLFTVGEGDAEVLALPLDIDFQLRFDALRQRSHP